MVIKLLNRLPVEVLTSVVVTYIYGNAVKRHKSDFDLKASMLEILKMLIAWHRNIKSLGSTFYDPGLSLIMNKKGQ